MAARLLVSRVALALLPGLIALAGCHQLGLPAAPAGYREFAYISNGGNGTVSVLDLVYLRPDRTLQVGTNPTGIVANPVRNEVYVVNSGSSSVSVIDVDSNQVVATIPVHRLPYFISIDREGKRAYVANSGSDDVSVLDLAARRAIGSAGAGSQPGVARVSPDGRSVVVSNRGSGSVSVFSTGAGTASGDPPLKLRSVFAGCPGATDVAILPDSSKAFIACTVANRVMAVRLAAAPGSWDAKQNPALLHDAMLTLLDVGKTPLHLTLKPDGGELFVSNFGSGSISAISTYTNEVENTFPIGSQPVHSLVSADNTTLWVANFSSDSISSYSIDDGHMLGNVRTGSGPDSLAFSPDSQLLLAADAHSGDVAIVRLQSKQGPGLFTILPAGPSPNEIAVKAYQGKR